MRILPLTALAAAATLWAGAAAAHAFLDHADPKVGSQVQGPRLLRLWFTQPLVPAFCRVTVSGPAGFGGAGPATPAPGDRQSLVVALNGPAPPGVYMVRWHVLSVDTHVTEGDYSFTVRP